MNLARRIRLTLSRAGGSVQRWLTGGSGRTASTLVGVSLALLVVPPLLERAIGLIPDSVWDDLNAGDGSIGRVWSVTNALAVWVAVMTLLWVIRARRRIVVEEIAVVGGEDEPLAGRLLDRLSRIRSLHGRVNEGDANPLSVGVKAMEDLKPGVELGQFLSASADDLGGTLDDVVAIEATVCWARSTSRSGAATSPARGSRRRSRPGSTCWSMPSGATRSRATRSPSAPLSGSA
jgi:hypothetical protein